MNEAEVVKLGPIRVMHQRCVASRQGLQLKLLLLLSDLVDTLTVWPRVLYCCGGTEQDMFLEGPTCT